MEFRKEVGRRELPSFGTEVLPWGKFGDMAEGVRLDDDFLVAD